MRSAINILQDYPSAEKLLRTGQVIAYPTEAVYGLGCDPFNQSAVEQLLALKNRALSKGLIVLIHSWEQLPSLIQQLPTDSMQQVHATWPGPVTWIFPKSAKIPDCLSGGGESIAIRMSAHPVAHELSRLSPIVSTSANVSNHPPARTLQELNAQFPSGLAGCMVGELGGAQSPSAIYDVLSGKRLR